MSSPIVLPPQNLPFSNLVQVAITIQANGAILPSFNKGLIITNDAVAAFAGSAGNKRIRAYTSVSAMLTDGFSPNGTAVAMATLYFSQTPPAQVLYVGAVDSTGLTASGIGVPSPTGDGAGSGYAVGDLVTPAGGTNALMRVSAVVSNGGTHGIPSVYEILSAGTGFAIASGVAMTTNSGAGTGATINITAVGETPDYAAQQCRVLSGDWYGFCMVRDVTSGADADTLILAAWAQASSPPSLLFASSATPEIANGTPGNLFLTMKAASYNRVYALYATTQNAAYPNNIYAGAAALGVAMGRNTGAANSYFTMMFKPLVGIVPEPILQSQVNAINAANGNVLVQYPNIPMMQKGNVPNGQFVDQIIQLDMLGADLQVSCVDELVDDSALNQTDSAQTRLLNRCNGACERAVTRRYVAPGIWNGIPVLDQLATGDTLASGYRCMSDTYNNQAESDRVARKSMPIYIALIQSGVVNSVLISVSVQQ